jgi:hypothetical protein
VEFARIDSKDDRSGFTTDGGQDRGAAFAGTTQSGAPCVRLTDLAWSVGDESSVAGTEQDLTGHLSGTSAGTKDSRDCIEELWSTEPGERDFPVRRSDEGRNRNFTDDQSGSAPFSGSLSPGQPKSTSETGSSTTISKQNGASAGQTPGQSEKAAKAGTGVGSSNGTTGALVGPEALDSGGGLRSTTHLSLPRDGQFGMVVVGSSAADEYPEAASTWSGRLAYTVYLHVGTHKNWILQYSIPRSQEVAKAGASARPEAPWPYDVTRPSIDPDTGAEAIIIHGFVNATGHFERLAIVFPAELAEAKFLLHALQQWEFRPATQNGVITQVEVLLIIPDETD